MKFCLYLDNCCFNRPYDDQSHLVTRLEAEAKLFVQSEILRGTFDLAWSYMLDYENSFNPYENRRHAIAQWRRVAKLDVDAEDELVARGGELTRRGLKKKDALHLACAIAAGCDYFLTTDKKNPEPRHPRNQNPQPAGFRQTAGGLKMKTDTVIRNEGTQVLLKHLGLVEAEQFIMLIQQEPFDYTKWREELLEEMSLEELSARAAKFRDKEKSRADAQRALAAA